MIANAVGLLKEELRRCGSLVLACADRTRVPAGGALAVDRERFSAEITRALDDHPLIERVAGLVERMQRSPGFALRVHHEPELHGSSPESPRTAPAFAAAITQSLSHAFDPDLIRRHAEGFGRERFGDAMEALVRSASRQGPEA